jgi:hypothetical protein
MRGALRGRRAIADLSLNGKRPPPARKPLNPRRGSRLTERAPLASFRYSTACHAASGNDSIAPTVASRGSRLAETSMRSTGSAS